jgi:hypothetical protein
MAAALNKKALKAELARLALRHHARRGMYRNAANIRASHLNFASVEARPQRQTHLSRSWSEGQGG